MDQQQHLNRGDWSKVESNCNLDIDFYLRKMGTTQKGLRGRFRRQLPQWEPDLKLGECRGCQKVTSNF